MFVFRVCLIYIYVHVTLFESVFLHICSYNMIVVCICVQNCAFSKAFTRSHGVVDPKVGKPPHCAAGANCGVAQGEGI